MVRSLVAALSILANGVANHLRADEFEFRKGVVGL